VVITIREASLSAPSHPSLRSPRKAWGSSWYLDRERDPISMGLALSGNSGVGKVWY
jgi:hypothetical protein